MGERPHVIEGERLARQRPRPAPGDLIDRRPQNSTGRVNLLLSFGVSPRVVMEIVGHNQRAALDLLNDRIAGAGEGGE